MSGKCSFQRWEKLGYGVRSEQDVVLFGRNHINCAIGRRVAKLAIPMWVGYASVYLFVGGVCAVVVLEVLV